VLPAQPPAPRTPPNLPDGQLSSMDGSARWILPAVTPGPEQATYVRHQARLVLQLWRLADLMAAVEVLISELATNAVRHARTLFTVTVAWDGATLRGEVNDASPVAPRPQLAPHPDREGGRGLLLLDAIATTWGVEMYPDGKTVWFTISRDSTAR
jgi:anti-sigma regulatory factor (Ser/Thr protein kinase)